ncbi:DUF4245 domain-containing protein [Herbiconiux sp. P15]|uniref:DUF4245 domain-containing protein n=1 Tax=Herbiconiux liukaitaii TaxID=3342799 RepID=UPI0035BA8C78
MARQKSEQAIVAELGRPETPDEAAARKAEASRLYRDRKTLFNLLYALLASVALVAAIVFLVPRSEGSLLDPIDYAQVAQSAQSSMPVPLAVPDLPAEWTSNAAEIRTAPSDGVVSWYIGLISPEQQYVGLTQGVDANPTWLSDQVAEGLASGVVTLDGVEWTIYDNSGLSDVGNVEYALTTEAGQSTFVVFGTAEPEEIEIVARSIGDAVLAQEETTE